MTRSYIKSRYKNLRGTLFIYDWKQTKGCTCGVTDASLLHFTVPVSKTNYKGWSTKTLARVLGQREVKCISCIGNPSYQPIKYGRVSDLRLELEKLRQQLNSSGVSKSCIICGNLFTHERSRTLCCSLACSEEYETREKSEWQKQNYSPAPVLTKECKECGLRFETNAKGVYCSKDCRLSANAEKRREWRQDIKDAFYKAYGGKCQCPGGCDITEKDFLGLDHVNNNGFRHRGYVGGAGYITYKDLERRGWPKGEYRLMCYNCNFARNYFGGCPHEKRQCRDLTQPGISTPQENLLN